MKLQKIQGRNVYVVDLPEIPQLPIYAINRPALPAYNYKPELAPYAEALDAAIRQGIVSQPGKYAIEIDKSMNTWQIFAVQE
jgi:hypothetical protein